MINWDQYFMSLAFFIAMKSKDSQTHNGAVIVSPDNSIVSTGYNSFVRNAKDDITDRQERPEKYFHFEHSERNAIYNAAREGCRSLIGCKMYVTGVPCMDCARGIIQVGIKEVVTVMFHTERMFDGGWNEHIDRTLKHFIETGVNLRFYEGELIDKITSRVRGVDYELNR